MYPAGVHSGVEANRLTKLYRVDEWFWDSYKEMVSIPADFKPVTVQQLLEVNPVVAGRVFEANLRED
jgi:hypothetical protein